MQGSRRILRSSNISSLPSKKGDIELGLTFSFQYSHFLKRHPNTLRVCIQRRKKYKSRAILGYKTLAFGSVNLSQVLQGVKCLSIPLNVKEESNLAAELVLTSINTTPLDLESTRRSSDDSRGSSEDGSEEDYSSDEDSAMEANPNRQNMKQRFSALLRKFKLTEEADFDIEPEFIDNQHVPNVTMDDAWSMDYDQYATVDPFHDVSSIYTIAKPTLRPFFDHSQTTLTSQTRDEVLKMIKTSSLDDLKPQKYSLHHQHSQDSDNKASSGVEEVGALPGSSPKHLRPDKHGKSKPRSCSMKDMPGRAASPSQHSPPAVETPSHTPISCGKEDLQRKIRDGEKITFMVLINSRECPSHIFASKVLPDTFGTCIWTNSDSDLHSALGILFSDFQKIAPHYQETSPLRVGVLGSDAFLSLALRQFVDHMSGRLQEFSSLLQFIVLPLGSSRMSGHLASVDSTYASLCLNNNWKEAFSSTDAGLDTADLSKRLRYFLDNPTVPYLLPIAEALVTYRSAEDDSCQACLPFLVEIKVRLETDDDATAAAVGQEQLAATKNVNIIPSSYSITPPSSHGITHTTGIPSSDPVDMQLDYWPALSTLTRDSKDRKVSLKSSFQLITVTRLSNAGRDDSGGLILTALMKNKSNRVMRLVKAKEKDTDIRGPYCIPVSKVVCSTRSQHQTFTMSIDGQELTGVRFFSLTPQWPTHVKSFPVGLFHVS